MTTITKKEVLSKLGQQIRLLRKQQQREIKQVAAELGITTQAFSNIENGKADISIYRLLNIALSIDVSPAELLEPLLETGIPNTENIRKKLRLLEKEIQELIAQCYDNGDTCLNSSAIDT